MYISGILDEIRSNYFIELSDVSYLAYAEDLSLLCKNKQDLSFMVSKVSRLISKIGLSLNVEKCEFLVFNRPTFSSAPLACRSFSIPFIPAFWWLVITVTNSISCLRQCTVHGVQKKIQMGYSKRVANRGKYNTRLLGRLYATF